MVTKILNEAVSDKFRGLLREAVKSRITRRFLKLQRNALAAIILGLIYCGVWNSSVSTLVYEPVALIIAILAMFIAIYALPVIIGHRAEIVTFAREQVEYGRQILRSRKKARRV